MGRPWDSISSRWAIGIAAAAIVLAVGLGIALTGGDDPAEAPESTVVEATGSEPSTPSVADAHDDDAEGGDEAKKDHDRASGESGNSKPERGGNAGERAGRGDDGANRDERHRGSSPGGPGDDADASSPDRDDSASGDCPAAFTAAQCTTAGQAVSGGASPSYDPEKCPPAFSAALCQAAGEAISGGASPGYDPEKCPPAFTAAQCQAAGEAIRQRP